MPALRRIQAVSAQYAPQSVPYLLSVIIGAFLSVHGAAQAFAI
jgi:hypothetical protein